MSDAGFNFDQLVAIDLETTGLNAGTELIIEVGAVKFDQFGNEEIFSSLVNPNRQISDFITDLTGITNEELRSAPTFDDVREDLQIFLDPIEEALLESEQLRLLPLLGELRDNAEHAWHQRIRREMAQLAEADWTARSEGRTPDPRWVRMKNSLITKLQDGLARRLAELDQIRDNLEGSLKLRVAIQIE